LKEKKTLGSHPERGKEGQLGLNAFFSKAMS